MPGTAGTAGGGGSSASGGAPSARDAGAGGSDADTTDAAIADAGAAAESLTFDVSFPLAAGSEEARCVVVQAGRASARQLVAVHAALGAGAAVLTLGRTSEPITATPAACDSTLSGFDELLFLTQTTTDLVLPDETALALPEGERWRIAVRAVNPSENPLDVVAHVSLDVLAESVAARAPARLFLGIDPSLSIAAMTSSSQSTFYALPAGSRAFAVSSTMHKYGVRATVRRAATAQDLTGAIVQESTDFSNPPRTLLSPPLDFSGSDGLRITCDYMNVGNSVVRFGETSSDEMCLLLAYTFSSP